MSSFIWHPIAGATQQQSAVEVKPAGISQSQFFVREQDTPSSAYVEGQSIEMINAYVARLLVSARPPTVLSHTRHNE